MADTVTVAVRVRPLNKNEKAAKCTEIQSISGKAITVKDPSGYVTDYHLQQLTFYISFFSDQKQIKHIPLIIFTDQAHLRMFFLSSLLSMHHYF